MKEKFQQFIRHYILYYIACEAAVTESPTPLVPLKPFARGEEDGRERGEEAMRDGGITVWTTPRQAGIAGYSMGCAFDPFGAKGKKTCHCLLFRTETYSIISNSLPST